MLPPATTLDGVKELLSLLGGGWVEKHFFAFMDMVFVYGY